MADDVKAILGRQGQEAARRVQDQPRRSPRHADRPGPPGPRAEEQPGRRSSGAGSRAAAATSSRRFIQGAFGSANAHGHTTVCQGSLYFAGKAMSEQFVEGKWQQGGKFYWQADLAGSEFVIFVGASPFEANYGPPLRTCRDHRRALERAPEDRRGRPAALEDRRQGLEVAPDPARHRGRACAWP